MLGSRRTYQSDVHAFPSPGRLILGRGYCFAPRLPTTRWLIACNSIYC